MSVRVCLVISAFRSDAQIKELLVRACIDDAPWSKVIVVDSLGSGGLPSFIEARGLGSVVEYHSFDRNLGSAGNLSERLRLAAAAGFDFAYAINHDGVVDAVLVRTLLAFAAERSGSRLGAVYPLRRFPLHDNRYDVTGRSRLPLPFQGVTVRPAAAFPVSWASSNGALYALDPVRTGIVPWADFFMSWEDLAYGWELEDQGYEQWVVTDALLDDDYEYARRGVGRVAVTVSDKPVWYAYYVARNLLLATSRTRSGVRTRAAVAIRIALECGVTLTLRSQKRERLKLIASGVVDGLRGVAGRGPVP